MDIGQQVLHDALALLATPQAAYVHGNELVKTALNKAFFTKLYVDSGRIAGHEMHEPFDKLLGAYEEYVIAQTSALLDGLAAKSAGILTDSGAHDLDSAVPSNALTWQVSGWSKASMVDDTGIEPVTPSVSGKCSPAELIVLGNYLFSCAAVLRWGAAFH